MISFDTRSIPLLGGATAAVLAGIYVLWGPSEKKKPKKRDLCPGLVNLGNSCFMNAVLQAFAPCTSIVQWLRDHVDLRPNSNYLGNTLGKVLSVLNNDSIEHTEEYCPSEVLDALRARRWVISSDEQDAHEMFHVLTETLEEESAKFPGVLSLFDANSLEDGPCSQYQEMESARSRTRGQLPILPGKHNDYPFRGLLASQLQCKLCGYKCPVKYDMFDSLSLSIPGNHMGTLTIEQMFRRYIMSETVQNVECEGCGVKQRQALKKLVGQPDLNGNDSPTPKTTFIKKLTIGKLPQCLCVHVQRTIWLDNGMPMKRFDHISFPEVLHMDNYVYHKKNNSMMSDRDVPAGLVGGRTGKNGYNQVNSKKMQATSPTVTVPYSRPVNLLKALNYHSRATMSGLFVQPAPAPASPVDQPSDHQRVQQLAQKYCSETSSAINQSHSYKLTAVVVHLGDVYSGHFITYRRAPSLNGQRFPDKWLYTSDTLVRKASLAEVMQAAAYMLFYEKI